MQKFPEVARQTALPPPFSSGTQQVGATQSAFVVHICWQDTTPDSFMHISAAVQHAVPHDVWLLAQPLPEELPELPEPLPPMVGIPALAPPLPVEPPLEPALTPLLMPEAMPVLDEPLTAPLALPVLVPAAASGVTPPSVPTVTSPNPHKAAQAPRHRADASKVQNRALILTTSHAR